MKKTKTTKVITEYTDQCPHCDKEIKGTKESQVHYLMKVHILAKHKEEKLQ